MEFRPATEERWPDLLRLFGPNGAYSGCWCMWNRQTNAEFDVHHGADNQAALRSLVADGPPGLLGYDDGEPVGWVSLGPYSDFARLARSPVAKPVTGTKGGDPDHTWAITCFVIRKDRRGMGIATALLDAAVAYAADQGASVVLGYPVDPVRRTENSAAWMGVASMFTAAGFTEVARRRPTRPVMKKTL
jgi:ribosomal protein S18 acetylase RimI-like enzyme